MTARDEVLARIRTALGSSSQMPPIPRNYRRAGEPPATAAGEIVALLVDRLVDYRATVTVADPGEVARRVAERLAQHRIGSVLVPDGFPERWLSAGSVERRTDDALTPRQLDAIDGVLCTCALAIAETGTIVLDGGPGQGRRALTLVPDYLLVLVRTDQIVVGVPEAVAQLDPSRPLTWISGPSATSDIELNRVEGVHGPRTLDVILVDTPAGA
jgi:L-lactate dehydrogenase complex protein LldG